MLHYKINFDELEWETPMTGVRSKTYRYGSKQLRLVEYSRNMPAHWCEKGHYGLLLEGELEIAYPTDTIVYRSGDGIFIPDGAAHTHQGRALTESVTVMFVEDV